MYKRWFIILLLLPGASLLRGQVSMTLQVPPMGVLVKGQLWNMLLVNTANSNRVVTVNLVLLDSKTSQPVLTAVSAPVTLGKGARQLQARDLGPIQYSYNSPAAAVDMDPNGLLPAGSYQACYSILNVEKGNTTMVENCIALNIDPLSPPLLNTPADEESLSTFYPQFTWLPPTPLGLFNDLSYDIVVVEVLAGQSIGDAVQQNIPVYTTGRLKNLYVNYPASFRALDTAKWYAWRIIALNNNQAVAMSDIRTFRIKTNKPAPRMGAIDPYIALQRTQDAAIATAGDILKITYDNVAADSSIQYTITSLEAAGNPVVQQGQVSLRYGRNQLQVPLSRSKGFQAGKLYLFRFTNSRQEAWSVQFTWIPARDKN